MLLPGHSGPWTLALIGLGLFLLLPLLLERRPEEPVDRLSLGLVTRAEAEPLIVARTLGYLPEERIKLVEFPSSADLLLAWRHHAIDAAAVSREDLQRLLADDQTFRIVLPLDRCAPPTSANDTPGSALIVPSAQSDLPAGTLQDLSSAWTRAIDFLARPSGASPKRLAAATMNGFAFGEGSSRAAHAAPRRTASDVASPGVRQAHLLRESSR